MSFIFLVLAGCDSAVEPSLLSDANPAKLMGKKWRWEGYTTLTGGYKTDVPAGSYFEINGDTLLGSSGCNRFWGECSVDPARLQMTDVVSTLLGCESVKDFVCELGEMPLQYHQRDSVLILVPQTGDMVHLLFRQQ